MATSIQSAAGNASNYANTVASSAQSVIAGPNEANTSDLWPIQNWSLPKQLEVAGVPSIETAYHKAFEQGRFKGKSVGDAMHAIQTKKLDLDEKIATYLNINRLAQDGQLSDVPRAIKYAADAVIFIQQIRTFNSNQISLQGALQANVQTLLAYETRMLNMLQANANALSNLLQEVCNWNIPGLSSLAAQLGSLFHWNGFNFCKFSGFNFNSSLNFNFGFNYSQCGLRLPDLAAIFANGGASSLAVDNLTLSAGVLPPPVDGGDYGDPTEYEDPAYIAKMQDTTTAVFDPTLVTASNGTSLPTPSSIVSNYALTPDTYKANVISAVPALAPAIVQATDADFGQATLSSTRQSLLRSLEIRYVTLAEVVQSQYDPNLTAAWLYLLQSNRAGRGGQWLTNFQAAFTAYIAPSIAYLTSTPVPWNKVLGGTGVNAGPAAIPLIAALQADTTNVILWKLSFIEASLLGYARTRTWDAAADTTFLLDFTHSDLDYQVTTFDLTDTVTVTLGADTAEFPVVATVPTAIVTVLADVIEEASLQIAAKPSFQSNRPQFRYKYDQFAQASLVDRYTQFWREFNSNLAALLTQDAYIIGQVVSYAATLDSAIDPLGDSTDFNVITTDASTRSRSWTPGSVLLPIPQATVLTATSTDTSGSTGWTDDNVFDGATYLQRPDVQAQPLPVQAAMLRTNQSYAKLMTLKASLQADVQTAVAAANLTVTSIGMPGWEVETNQPLAVPPGAAGLIVPFNQVDFDQTGYVRDPSTIVSQAASPFIVNVVLNWDATEVAGARTVIMLQNGTPVATSVASPDSATPFLTQFSLILTMVPGDILEVVASHSISSPLTLLSGSTFLGLVDTTAQQSSGSGGTTINTTINNYYLYSGQNTYVTGATFPAYTAVSQSRADGRIYPITPADKTVGATPFVDGITLAASTEVGASVAVAVAYGSIYKATGVNWIPGGLLYVAADGSLTQDYQALITNTRWVVCIGKALAADSFIFTPHLPTNVIRNF